ncbi:hypothetical protein ALT1000_20094 [Alteromonas macleodii]
MSVYVCFNKINLPSKTVPNARGKMSFPSGRALYTTIPSKPQVLRVKSDKLKYLGKRKYRTLNELAFHLSPYQIKSRNIKTLLRLT